MTLVTSKRAVLIGTALLTAALPAWSAEDVPEWSPGNDTTSRLPGEVQADDVALGHDDGVYGRLDGAFDLGLSAGAEFGTDSPAGNARASLHYYSMAGVYAAYVDAFRDEHPTSRLVSLGIDLRPLFVPRWAKSWEAGPGTLDLVIDSLSLSLGAFFASRRGSALGEARGLDLSLGFGVPLTGRAAGPWVRTRGNLRWNEPADRALATLLVALGWDWVL